MAKNVKKKPNRTLKENRNDKKEKRKKIERITNPGL
jgi:hypothetical protein